MTDKKSDSILVKKVRLSYPHLDQKYAGEEGQKPRYSATFLVSKKDEDTVKQVKRAIEDALIKKFGTKEKVPKGFKKCLRDGDAEDCSREEYAGHWYFSAADAVRRPSCVNGRKEPIAIDDIPEVFYAGCYVNAAVRFWVQDNKFGKRVNASLRGVQFAAKGERFGAPGFDPNEFEELEEEESFDSSGDDDDSYDD